MKECPYCCEQIPDDARKCKECGEILSFFGRILRIVPVFSVLIAAASLGIAWVEIEGRQAAEGRERVAVKREQAVSEDLELQKSAADLALADFAGQLNVQSREQVKTSLEIPPNMTLERLETQAQREPKNVDLQRKAMVLRALEGRR